MRSARAVQSMLRCLRTSRTLTPTRDDGAAGTGQRKGDAASDTLPGTGDDRNLAGQRTFAHASPIGNVRSERAQLERMRSGAEVTA